MENGKSPRVDGIPIEFYNEVLETIILDLQKTFNETLFTNKKTTKTWNHAIITLIPKRQYKTTQVLETDLTFVRRL